MATQDDVDTLVAFGVFQAGGLEKLAGLVRAVQSLAGGGNSTGPVMSRPRGRPRGRPAGGGGPGRRAGSKRAAKGAFNPTKDELSKMKNEGMVAREIAEKFGVSQATVNNRLRQHGLTNPRKKGKK